MARSTDVLVKEPLPDMDIHMLSDDEKDETDEALERLVFGDRAGFSEGLHNFTSNGLETITALDSVKTGLETTQDAELFFTDLLGDIRDAGDDDGEADIGSDNDNCFTSNLPAVWEDSDDERISVSLANVPRLRKLRRTENEDVVNGKEYSRRLRKQYELLHPRPEWAIEAAQAPVRKKRRTSVDQDSDDATLSQDDVESEDITPVEPLSELLRRADGLVSKGGSTHHKKRKLRAEIIEIQRTKDIPGVQPSTIASLSFHPEFPLLLSSGPAATLYLHQIGASPSSDEANPLLTSLHVRNTGLTTSSFHPTDSRIFFSGRKRYFHVWDLQNGQVEKVTQIYGHQHEQRSMERFKLSPDGKYMALLGSARKGGGVVNILSSTSLQWISQVRVESRNGIAEFAWWRDSRGLTIAGKNGEMTEWSAVSKSVIARWQDEGAVGTTTIALGGRHEIAKSEIGTDRWIAIGSSPGIVNTYDRREWSSKAQSQGSQCVPEQPKPVKTLDHLTTPISNLAFSPDGQILAMSSRWSRDALRLVHLPSCTVYRNWPTDSTPLGRITAVAFDSGEKHNGDAHSLLAVANEQGKIRLWEIR